MKQVMKELLQEFIERDFTTHEMRIVFDSLDELTELKRSGYSQTVLDYIERKAQKWFDAYGITLKLDDLYE